MSTFPPRTGAPADGDVDPDVLAKVRALLAKAESTTFPAEAEAFTAKAQELMARYRIDQALLDPGGCRAHEPRRRTLHIDDPYASAKGSLYHHVAQANGCYAIFGARRHEVDLFGAPDDLVLVETLVTSLLVQATVGVQAAGPQRDAYGRSTTRSFRRAFYLAFAQRIGERLKEAVQQAYADLDDDDRDRALPVLADRDAAVREVVTRTFPHIVSRRATSSNRSGLQAGRLAADAADLSVGPAVPR
jgi:hypothetical protein